MDEFSLFGIIGNPVSHSKSPLMFNSAFKTLNINAHYTTIAGKSVEKSLLLAKTLGFKGINVTAPFKEKIIPLLDFIDEDAVKIGSVNCVVFKNDKTYGYNTDYIGVIDSIKSKNIDLYRKKVAVIGAGGAGKAAIYGVLKEKGLVTLFNRSIEKGKKIAEEFSIDFYPLTSINSMLENFDIVISTISSDVLVILEDSLHKDIVVFDANYKTSPLIEMAENKGITTIKGIDWLFYQAVPAFELFLGIKPPKKEMKQSLIDVSIRYPFKNNIALIGFMASGKTKIGSEIGRKIKKKVIDTDKMIIKRTNMPIEKLFLSYGEEKFRILESDMLKLALSGLNQLISCGGGIILKKENRDELKKNAFSIWLYASIETTLSRIKDKSRPLLNSGNLFEKASSLMNKRKDFYAVSADMIVSTDDVTDNILGIIYDEISQAFKY